MNELLKSRCSNLIAVKQQYFTLGKFRTFGYAAVHNVKYRYFTTTKLERRVFKRCPQLCWASSNPKKLYNTQWKPMEPGLSKTKFEMTHKGEKPINTHIMFYKERHKFQIVGGF